LNVEKIAPGLQTVGVLYGCVNELVNEHVGRGLKPAAYMLPGNLFTACMSAQIMELRAVIDRAYNQNVADIDSICVCSATNFDCGNRLRIGGARKIDGDLHLFLHFARIRNAASDKPVL
jgi:hypothetical protein